jgi:diguanylate cyclase (GGDEF)-like protein
LKTILLAPKSGTYIYFGGADGRFVGSYQVNSYLRELYLRQPGASKRRVYALDQSGAHTVLLRTDDFDPRVRPWYVAAAATASQERPVWSPVYNDFTSGKQTITVARSINDANRKLTGVAAVDIELYSLADRLVSLAISQNGTAFVMDSKGFIIASSEQDLPVAMRDGASKQLHASEMKNNLIRDSHAKILEWKNRQNKVDEPLSLELETNCGVLNVAAATVGNQQGIDWVTAVVAPSSDFMANVTHSFNKSLAIAVVCVLISLLLGMLILNRLLRDIYALNDAARRIGKGENVPPLEIHRKDELGQLARTFHEMGHNLRTDKLTGAYNREYLFNRIRLMQEHESVQISSHQPFALLFIDLDDFKAINDQYGHDVGDVVLIEIASRLNAAIRANDAVVRYGGDEFVVLLNDMNSEEAIVAIEEKIRTIVEAPIALDRGELKAGISVGWALFPRDGTNVERLLKIADERMFDVKKTRKNLALNF